MSKNKVFYWNVFVPVTSMNRLEGDFYKKLYEYRYFCTQSEKNKVANFRSTPAFTKMLDSLNLSYEKIKNLAGVEKNDLGEYDYPKVSYKVRKITQNNKSSTVLYCCIADTTMNREFTEDDILSFAPLYAPGTLKSVQAKDNIVDVVLLECFVGQILNYFKSNYSNIMDFSDVKSCTKVIQWLDKFPINSISEINFNSLASKILIESFIQTTNEMIEVKKEA